MLFKERIAEVLDGRLKATPQSAIPGYTRDSSRLYQRSSLDGMSNLALSNDLEYLDRQVRGLTRPETGPPYVITPYGNKIELRLVET